jgi:hypothetical protein
VRLVPTILLLVVVSLPAAAQTRLAQQCAAFGEVQYRKLSPSVDRVTALDFPPPALERVEAKVGSQAIVAALTLRGRLTYRSGAPFETQFVCLLVAAQRPLFFYALPALATRGAPTPATRGGAPTPTPPLQPAPTTQAPTLALGPQAAFDTTEPARPPLPAGTVRLRGLVRDLGGRLQFLPCDGAPLTLEDRTPDQERRGRCVGRRRARRAVQCSSSSMADARPVRARALARWSCVGRPSRRQAVANGSTSANGLPAAEAGARHRGGWKSRRGT